MRAIILLRYYQFKHALKALFICFCLLLTLSFAFNAIFIDMSHLLSVPIALVDEDQTETSKLVTQAILSKNILHTETLGYEDAYKQLQNHRIEAVVLIKSDFEASLKEGHYEKIIDLIYLDRSTSAPALTDVIAGAVLKEACAYHAISQVARYDSSPEAIAEITEKVRTSIQSQEYSVPLDVALKAPLHVDNTRSNIPFEAQLPKRLALGYTLFVALLVVSLYAGQIATEITSFIGKRIQTSPKTLFAYTYSTLILSIGFFVLLFGGMMLFFIGLNTPHLLENLGVLSLQLGLTLSTWMITLLAISIFFKGKSSLYTLMLPLVILTSLISGCFWPLDFISRQVMKPISYLPSYQFLTQIENLLIGQPLSVVDIAQPLLFLIISLFLLWSALKVTVLKNA